MRAKSKEAGDEGSSLPSHLSGRSGEAQAPSSISIVGTRLSTEQSEVSAANTISELIAHSRQHHQEVAEEYLAQWEALSSSSSRFRVVSTPESLILSGTLPDASDLRAMYGMEVGTRKIDLHGITVVSYSAMIKLVSELEKTAKKLEFIRVPFSLRQVLETLNKADAIISGENVRARPCFRDVEIQRVGIDQVDSDSGHVAPDMVEILADDYHKYPSNLDRDLKSDWAVKNREEACFWQDYFGFIQNVTNQVDLNLAAALISIQRKFTLLDIRSKTFSKAWALMGLESGSGTWDGEKNNKEISLIANNLLPLSKKMLHTNEKLLAAVQLACHSHDYDIRNAFSYLFDLKQSFIHCASSLEAVGTRLGELLSGLSLASESEQKLAERLRGIPQETIAEILETIGIMNPDAESDPNVAAEEIFLEIKLAENDIHGCIIDLQAFDLVKQILERRTASLTLILKHLNSNKNDATNWATVRRLISLKIQTEFSSIQEKVSYNRYLGYLGVLPISSEFDASKDDFLF